jgi:hypothetical protein
MRKVYDPRLCKNLRDYFTSYVGYWERKVKQIEQDHPGEDMQAQSERIAALEVLVKEHANRARLTGLPSLEKWASKIGVTPSTVSRWRKEYPEFDEVCRDCLAIQTDILRDGGLGGVYSSRVAVFLIGMNEERERLDARDDDNNLRFEDFEELEDLEGVGDDGKDTS